MTLKTATVIVIAVLVLNTLTTIGLQLRHWPFDPSPPMFVWVSVFSAVGLKLCLLLFFVTLYRNQRSSP